MKYTAFTTGMVLTIGLFLSASPSFAALRTLPPAQAPEDQRDRYEADLFTGSARYEYPLTVPPGTNGLTPQLTVSYSSLGTQDVSSFLGIGWNLSADFIERDTRYTPDDSSDDTFTLHFQNSTQPLVYVPSENRYHTKVESFLHIQKISTNAQNTSGEYWQVITKDGTSYRFGFLTGSELWCEGRSYPRRYYLDLVEDTHGNTITFSYLEDAGSIYPGKIEYNNDKQRTIEFSYEANPSLRSVYPGGCAVSEHNRLTGIQMKAAGAMVRSYSLSYAQAANTQNLLTGITERGSDGSSLPPATFSYQAEVPKWNLQHQDWLNNAPIDAHLNQDDVRVVDVNGDALPDIVRRIRDGDHETWRVWKNTGNSRQRQHEDWFSYTPAVSAETDDVQLIDVSGDRLPDMVRTVPDGGQMTWRVWLNTGSSFLRQSADWFGGVPLPADLQMHRVVLSDVTGDGLVDIVKTMQNSDGRTTWKVWRNNGYAPGLIKAIRTAGGGISAYEYIASSRADLLFPLWLVEKSVKSDAAYSFSYRGGRYDPAAGGFRGFRQVTGIDTGNRVTDWVFHQTDELSGRLDTKTVTDPHGRPTEKTEYIWNVATAHAVHTVTLATEKRITYAGARSSPDIRQTDYTYDTFGSVTKTSDFHTPAEDGRSFWAEYVYDPARRMIDALSRLLFRSSADNIANVTRLAMVCHFCHVL